MFGRSQTLISALDIGSDKVRAVIAQVRRRHNDARHAESEDHQPPLKIVGVAEKPAKGIEQGEIVDIKEAAQAIKTAVGEASHMASVSVKDIAVSLNGRHARAVSSVGDLSLAVSPSGTETKHFREIIEADLQNAVDRATAVTVSPNEKMLHTILQDYAVDGGKRVKNPRGKTGGRLEAFVEVIIASQNAICDLESTLNKAGLSPGLMLLQSLALAKASFTPEEREEGTLLIDMGKGTTHAIIYFRGTPRYMSCVAMGGELVTHDLKECLRVDRFSAEKLKMELGCGYDKPPTPMEGNLESLLHGPPEDTKDSLAIRAISARYAEIFLIIEKDIHRTDSEQFLKGGVVLTGGASNCPGLTKLARSVFGVKVRAHECTCDGFFDGALTQPEYTNINGLLLHGLQREANISSGRSAKRSKIKKTWDVFTFKNAVFL